MNGRLVLLILLGAVGGLVGFGLFAGADSAGFGGVATLVVLLLVVGLIVYTLSGNRAQRRASPEERAMALGRVAPPDRALIYVMREGFVGMAAGVDVTVDGRQVVQLKSPRFSVFTVAPGPHEILTRFRRQVGALKAKPMFFTAAPGETLIFSLLNEPFTGLKAVSLLPPQHARARADMARITMVAPDIADL